ncbi:MAG: hypothetical protein R2867_19750 [Caldilineaceae bacterium]
MQRRDQRTVNRYHVQGFWVASSQPKPAVGVAGTLNRAGLPGRPVGQHIAQKASVTGE